MVPPHPRSSMPPPRAPSRRQTTRAHSDSYHPIYSAPSASSSSSSSSSAGSDTASIFSHASTSSSATSASIPSHTGNAPRIVRPPPRPRPARAPPSSVSVPLCDPDTGNTTVVLPRTLARPKPQPVSPAALSAASADLDGVPLAYILQSLREIGPRMMAALARTTAPAPGALPRDLAVFVAPDPDPDPELDTLPTHLLAVYARSGAEVRVPRRKVTLFPTHAVMLAAHCAHLPPLPPGGKAVVKEAADVPPISLDSEQDGRDADDEPPAPAGHTALTLPVVPLCIPAPKMFPALQTYLYTKRADHLLNALIPNTHPGAAAAAASAIPTPTPPPHPRVPSPALSLGAPSPPPSESDLTPRPSPAPSTRSPTPTPLPALIPDSATLAAQLAAAHTAPTLVRAALRTHGVWADAAALGVFDERLWLTIDFAWRVLLGALERGAAVEAGSDSNSDEKDDKAMQSNREEHGVQVETAKAENSEACG